MSYNLKRLANLAEVLFNVDCKKENLLCKIDEFNEKIINLKHRILEVAGYPEETQVYELGSYVITVSGRDIEVYSEGQYDKVETELGYDD